MCKEALKKCDALLDISNDSAKIFGTPLSLGVSGSDHYIIPLHQQFRKAFSVVSLRSPMMVNVFR